MSWIEVTYHLRGAAADAEARARAIAVEQSIEMPPDAVDDPFVLGEILGRVVAVEPRSDGLQAIRIRLSAATVGGDAGQLLNMLFGNSSLHDDLTLAEIAVPPELRAALRGGSQIGLDGLRERVGAKARALTCSALKPQGLPAKELARLAEAFALGSIDYVKDDHGLATQAYSPFPQRVSACAAAMRRAVARTGHATRYVPSLSGSLDAVREQLHIICEEGLDTAMVAPAILGLANVQQIRRDYPDVAFLAHPSLAGAARIDPACLTTLWRLAGVDAVIFPNHGGRFGYSAQTCERIAQAALAPEPGLAAIAPVPAGGMSVARVPEMLDFYGRDVMLLIGGNLLAEGDRLSEATAAFVATVHRHSQAQAPAETHA
ncbi:MAG: ribulose 1,5-bisphosphate carboxylase [Bosea sp.]|uniref:RuBisCO large subunit C-terminal-like domain-containing protein n=1 Tax=Bosea sp. (in: a-proteobacteria) TaxID=1871050 RepID=UPI00239282AB|nr:ribulose 1,5-bisphosphate carboxylase [Bosea sp. (in: a-proteobacteria)]MCP4739566.1 ribulose 1,5-bisphosphate carboxylase [Bosea sp. (in: a-proteobacteria)]